MKFCAYFCLLAVIINAVLVKGDYPQVVAERSFLNYMLTSNAINEAADPAATAACFTKYLPILSEVGSTFSTQYQACITLANQQIADLTTAAEGNRTNFIKTTQDICSAYTTCNADTEILNFFDCYASASQQDVSVVYDLQTNATNAAAALSQGIRLVQQEENTCTNNTEETYVKNTAATYALLNTCLTAAGASTLAPITIAPSNTNVNANAFVEQTDCSTSSDTRTQISPDGTQTQTQTGPGCQTQNSGDGSQSQSQNGNGKQSQSQCSGSNCGEMKPMKPLFTFAPMATMAPMQPLN